MNMKLARWIFGGWALLAPLLSCAQEADPAAEATEPAPSRGWWTASLEAANNSSFYGRISPRAYPYVAPTLTYVHPIGLWASATAYQLFNTEDYIDETDVS